VSAALHLAQTAGTSATAPLIAAIASAAGHHDREGSFPFESLALLHDAGVLALTVPMALGGGGAGLRLAADAGRVPRDGHRPALR